MGGMKLEKEKHIVRLALDKAELPEEPDGTLRFGPAGSFGIHTLQVEAGEGWEGRVISATFQNRHGGKCVEVLLSGGVVAVPAEATEYSTAGMNGIITFVGVDDKSRRVTCKLPYYVEESGCVCGEAPAPCPSKWQQFVDEVKAAAATGGYKIGTGLVVDEETNTLSVDTAEAVEEDNTKPVTSAAVYTQLGNVEALLHSI